MAAQQLRTESFIHDLQDIDATVHKVYDANNKACALVKVQLVDPSAEFVGDVVKSIQDENEYWAYMAEGATYIRVKTKNYLPYEFKFPEPLVAGQTYVLIIIKYEKTHPRNNGFYLEAGGVFGSLKGAEFSLGVILSGFNIELDGTLPLGMSEQLWWNHPTQESVQCSYKPGFSMAGRMGFVIGMRKKFRFTPQVGMRFLKTSEEAVGSSSPSEHASGSNVSSLLLALKFQLMFGKHVGLSLTPEYDLPLMKSEGFEALASASSKINKWNNGIGAKLALHIAF